MHVQAYRDDTAEDPFNGTDGIVLRVAATANTRKGIEYTHTHWGHLVDGFPNPQYMDPTGITGDDSGTWVNLPFRVYFYGGGGSGIQNRSGYYDKIWVCSNGFISFDAETTSPYPRSIPSDFAPNALIAVYWTDLDPSGGSIKYQIWESSDNAVVIVWDNVLNKARGTRETFGVIIEQETEPVSRGQSKIRFLYKSVSGDTNAVIGLEDQEGYRGYTPGFTPTGEDELWFRGVYDAPEIRELSIKVEKPDSQAEIYMSTYFLKGVNLDWEAPQEDPESTYEIVIKGVGTLLMSEIAGIGNPFGGLMFGTALLGYELVKDYARQNWPVNYLTHNDAGVNESLAYISASAKHIAGYDWPVDTTLTDKIYWVFTEQNTAAAEHFIKIFAEIKYYSYKYGAIKTKSTSVELTMTPDISDDFSNPKRISADIEYKGCLDTTDPADMYVINVEANKIIYVEMMPPADANYDLYLYNSSQAEVDSSTRSGNSTEFIFYAVEGSSGDYYIKVQHTYWARHMNNGVYKIKVDIRYGGSGGGGCPYISTWNGTQYVTDNNILPASELSNGTDVEDYYKLEKNLIPKNGKHSLIVSEFEQEHSYLDQVKLLAVDHESDVNIAVTSDGEILTYKNPVAPLSAVDDNGTNRLDEISFMDGNVSDPITYFYGEPGDHLVLNFGQVNSENAKLIFRDDMIKHKECIEVQVKDSNDNWQTVEVLIPRNYWSMEAVNLSPYIVSGRDLMVRLYWKYRHRLDYVGLDTTQQDDYKLHTANLVSATHSTQGDAKTLLLESDNNYAELVPGQEIQLKFTLPNNSEQARTYVLYTKGYYYTIT